MDIKYTTGKLTDLVALPSGKPKDRARIKIGTETYGTSARFWHSICSQFQISTKIFGLFSHAEVFDRLTKNPKFRETAKDLRFCIEDNGKSKRLLAISPDGKTQTLRYSRISDMLESKGGKDIQYHDGLITARFTPPSGAHEYKLGPDAFTNRLLAQVPVDGYGDPAFFLELLRLVCLNGMTAYTKSFRSTIKTGKDAYFAVNRAIESYDNDSGFASLQARFQLAQNSWASVGEVMALGQLIHSRPSTTKYSKEFRNVTGDLCAQYGMTNLEAIPLKKRVLLPTKARMYDLLNFATELATHKADVADGRVLNAHVGRLLASPFDLEGSADKVTKFKDFLTT